MFAFHASAWYNRPHTNICTLEDVCGKACGQDVGDGDTVSGPTIIEIECKSMLNRVNVSWLPFDWSVNPYRGCFHGCVYCYARRYHEEYLEIDPGAGFDRQVFVKRNAVEVLRRELARKSWRRERVAIGTAVDAYQPAEGKYRVTRRILEAFADYETPCSLMTKNTMIVRDIDVLGDLARGPGVKIGFSITTLDPALARRIEPDTPPPHKRLRVLERLAAAGVPVGVLMAPILPGLNDDDESLEAVVRAAAEHGATFLTTAVLRLQGSVKSVYGRFLRADSPELLPLYRSMYAGAYAPRAYQERLYAKVAELKARYGFTDGTRPIGTSRPTSPPGWTEAAPTLRHVPSRAARTTAAGGAPRRPSEVALRPAQLTLF